MASKKLPVDEALYFKRKTEKRIRQQVRRVATKMLIRPPEGN